MALDIGFKRIGIAVGDTTVGIAFARDTLHLGFNSQEEIFNTLLANAQKEKIKKILVGHPGALTEIGTAQAQYCRNFADDLEDFLCKQNVPLPVEFIDESFSTRMAEKQLQEVGVSSKDQRKHKDALAAAAFLQIFLDREKKDF